MVKDKTYITIQSWMRNELNLKGTDLVVYALIYGFSMDGVSEFKAPIGYIVDWTGSSKSTVIRSLKSLVDNGFVVKTDIPIADGLHVCSYKAVIPDYVHFEHGGVKMTPGECQNDIGRCQNDTGGGVKMTPNNNIYKDKYINIYKNIMSFLNEKAGTHYRYDVKKNQELMKARLDEGFTVDDFYKVIDNMVSAWKNNPKMKNYLRPQTLFGTKFESYLNRIGTGNAYRDSKTEEQRKQDDEVLAILRGDYD